MRIIAGKFKGRVLQTEKGDSIRPTSDRVKENIFNLIQNKIKDSEVLDLFCGSGALGIEALSRGAKNCVFCDKSQIAIDVLKTNLTKIQANFEIFNREYSFVLSQLGRENKKFDIVFLDPPYGQIDESLILEQILQKQILSDDGVIILERRNESKNIQLPFGICLTDSRTYGNTIIDMFELGHAVAITGTFDPYTLGHEYLVETAINRFKVIHIVILDNPQKTPEMPLKNRIKNIQIAVRKFSYNIVVSYYKGLAIDYCKNNDIRYIIRGIRNQKDFSYESQMAEWNEKNGGIKTLFIQAKDAEISSTLVKKLLSEGEDATVFLPKE